MLANYLGLPAFRVQVSSFQELLKRGFDIVVATAGLMLLSPLIILLSLAIKLDSRGPVFCRLKYYDLNDVAFEALEFRATHSDTSNPATNKGHSITRMGQILRRSGLDKVPQLINVLRGDMSLVGPEPFTTACGEIYRARIAPELLCNVRPGIVSGAQVRDGGDRVEDDFYYLSNRSFILDMKILVLALLLKNTQM